jgi:hypothetical protein
MVLPNQVNHQQIYTTEMLVALNPHTPPRMVNPADRPNPYRLPLGAPRLFRQQAEVFYYQPDVDEPQNAQNHVVQPPQNARDPVVQQLRF